MKKFTISSEVLKAALKKLAQAVNKNATVPTIVNLYCKVSSKEVTFITTDLELTIMITCECEATHSFEALINFEFLSKIVALSNHQPLVIEVNGNKGRLYGENHKYELGTLEKVADFPKLPEVPKQKFIKMNGTFIDWLGKAQGTVGKDDLRPALTKICLDIKPANVKMVSTDAHVVFTRNFPCESKESDQLLISTKIAKALDGFSETEIYWHKQHIAFKSDNVTVIATRSEDKFPNYEAVFPADSPENLLLDKAALSDALANACLSSDSTKHTVIYLNREPGTIHFESTDLDLNRKIQVEIPGSYKGHLGRIAISASWLMKLVSQVDYDKLHLSITDATKPIVITSESDLEYKSLIIPLTITEEN